MCDNKKHILFLARWYPHRYDPMYGLFVQRHAIAVAQKQTVSAIYIHADEQCNSYSDYSYTKNSVNELLWYYPQVKGNAFIKGIQFFRYLIKAYKFIVDKEGKPDIVHVNILTRLGVFALLLKYLYGIPYVITEHWSRYKSENGTYSGVLRKFFTKIVVKNASAVITVTKDLQHAMQYHGLNNKHYYSVPNVVDTQAFCLGHHHNSGKKEIVHISCFEEKSKNITGILNVIKALSERRSDFVCRMVGEGMDLEESIAYAKNIGLSDDVVIFEGLKQGDALTTILKNADVFFLFSNYENLPVVILESFACGVPVVSTDVGGIAEYMNPYLGILVPPNDQQAAVDALEYVFDNNNKYDAEVIRDFAVNSFSNDVVGQDYCDIYKKILNK